MEVKGKVKIVSPEQVFGASGFRKRELVVTTDEQYPQPIMVEFVQDKCDLLNPIRIGQEVTISINLRGREWINPQGEAKYFNSIQGWRIEINERSENIPDPVTMPDTNMSDNTEEPDDLPF